MVCMDLINILVLSSDGTVFASQEISHELALNDLENLSSLLPK